LSREILSVVDGDDEDSNGSGICETKADRIGQFDEEKRGSEEVRKRTNLRWQLRRASPEG